MSLHECVCRGTIIYTHTHTHTHIHTHAQWPAFIRGRFGRRRRRKRGRRQKRKREPARPQGKTAHSYISLATHIHISSKTYTHTHAQVNGRVLLGMVGYDSMATAFFELLRAELNMRSMRLQHHVRFDCVCFTSHSYCPFLLRFLTSAIIYICTHTHTHSRSGRHPQPSPPRPCPSLSRICSTIVSRGQGLHPSSQGWMNMICPSCAHKVRD
jgi:hypothetical protein